MLDREVHPDQSEAILIRATKGLAFNFRELGDDRQAERAYREAFAQAPAAAELRFHLALHLQAKDQPKAANYHYREAQRHDATYADRQQATLNGPPELAFSS